MALNGIFKKKVITVTKDCTLVKAAALMADNHIGNLIVVDDVKQKLTPIGLITDRDIAVKAVGKGRNVESTTVEEIMNKDLIVAHEFDGIYDVIEVMKNHGVNRIPIVDGSENLVGILTSADLLDVVTDELAGLASLGERQKNREGKSLRQ